MKPLLFSPLLFAVTAAAASAGYTVLNLSEGDKCNFQSQSPWHCKSEEDCMGSTQALKGGWKPGVCSYKNGKMILCCPPSEDLFPQPTTTSNSTEGEISQLSWTSWHTPTSGWNFTKKPAQNSETKPILVVERSTHKPPDVVTSSAEFGSASAGTAAAKADAMCKSYIKHASRETVQTTHDAKPVLEEFCRRTETLVFGGEDALPYEFPHMARIGYGEADNIEWSCGGSLISERFILSAAHCSVVGNRPASWANLGDTDSKSEKDVPAKEVVTVRIMQVYNHPDYNGNRNWYNDVALFKLEKDLKLGVFVRPACLNTRRQFNKKNLVAIGWGLTSALNEGSSSTLQKVNLDLVSHDECNSRYSELNVNDRIKFDEGIRVYGQLCAGAKPLKAICLGDSGGPLNVFGPNCTFDVVGVISFGKGCKSSYPGVYTNVVDYVPWIVNIVWGLE